MNKKFLTYLLTISFSLLLITGCAKDQVKPDEGIAGDKAAAADTSSASQTAAQQKLAAEKAAQEAAAQKAAQEAAAQRAAQEAAAQKAAQEAAAQKAAQEKAAQELQQQQSATQSSTSTAAGSADSPLQRIHFDFDSYVLTQPSRDILYNNADYLLKKYQGKIKLEGYCDERGTDEYNLALGENRAKSAMNYLITLGVPAEQLSIISYGEERPLDSGHNEDAWAKNRRVEFTIVK